MNSTQFLANFFNNFWEANANAHCTPNNTIVGQMNKEYNIRIQPNKSKLKTIIEELGLTESVRNYILLDADHLVGFEFDTQQNNLKFRNYIESTTENNFIILEDNGREMATIQINAFPLGFNKELLQEKLEKFGQIVRFQYLEDNKLGWKLCSNNLKVKLLLNENISLNDLPCFIKVNSYPFMLMVKGLAPVCHYCKIRDHKSKDCNHKYSSWCKEIKSIEHECKQKEIKQNKYLSNQAELSQERNMCIDKDKILILEDLKNTKVETTEKHQIINVQKEIDVSSVKMCEEVNLRSSGKRMNKIEENVRKKKQKANNISNMQKSDELVNETNITTPSRDSCNSETIKLDMMESLNKEKQTRELNTKMELSNEKNSEESSNSLVKKENKYAKEQVENMITLASKYKQNTKENLNKIEDKTVKTGIKTNNKESIQNKVIGNVRSCIHIGKYNNKNKSDSTEQKQKTEEIDRVLEKVADHKFLNTTKININVINDNEYQNVDGSTNNNKDCKQNEIQQNYLTNFNLNNPDIDINEVFQKFENVSDNDEWPTTEEEIIETHYNEKEVNIRKKKSKKKTLAIQENGQNKENLKINTEKNSTQQLQNRERIEEYMTIKNKKKKYYIKICQVPPLLTKDFFQKKLKKYATVMDFNLIIDNRFGCPLRSNNGLITIQLLDGIEIFSLPTFITYMGVKLIMQIKGLSKVCTHCYERGHIKIQCPDIKVNQEK